MHQPADLKANPRSRLKPLLIAEAANPEWASVPLVGWSLARAVMAISDAHLVTQIRNRPAVLRAGLVEGENVTFIDNESIARPLHQIIKVVSAGKSWTVGTAISTLAYYSFERKVWEVFGQRLKQREFDVVHRITPLSPVVPSIIARRCAAADVPFVLGPLNGGVPWPKQFRSAQHQEREWLSYVRGAYKLLPGHNATRKHASAILIASRHTMALESSRHHGKCIYLPENGIDPSRFNLRASIPNDGPLKVCFVGRLVPYKGIDMLLEAARPLVDQGLLEIDVVGDGPMKSKVEELAGPHLGAAIRLHGWLPHDQVQNVLSANHVLGFPSIREFGGGVVLEAMALGVVPMIVDYAGPAELVTSGTGFKIPLAERASIVQSFRTQLSKVAGERDVLRVMSAAGRATVLSQYTWAAKAEQIRLVYDWVCAGGEKPMPFALQADPTLVASQS